MPPTSLKPPRWNWSPARLESEYRNIARDLAWGFDFRDDRSVVPFAGPRVQFTEHTAGQVTQAVAPYGQGWEFGTTGAKTTAYSGYPFTVAGGFSIMFVVDFDDSGDAFQVILAKRNDAISTRAFYVLMNNRNLQTGYSTPVNRSATASSLLTDLTVNVVAFSANESANTIRYYKNGAYWGSVTPPSGFFTDQESPASSTGWSIGQRGTGNTSDQISKSLGLLTAWDYALTDTDLASITADPFGLIRKELWTPDLAPTGGASGNGSFAVTHTHSTAFTASEGEVSSFAVSHTHSVAFTASEGEIGSFAVTHNHSVAFTGSSGATTGSGDFAVTHTHTVAFSAETISTRALLAARIELEATAAGQSYALVQDHPPSGPVAVPAVFIAPGDPWLQPGGPAGYRLRLDTVIFVGRLDVATAWDDLETWLPIVKAAAIETELQWQQASVGVESLGGVDYVTARVSLQGETRNP